MTFSYIVKLVAIALIGVALSQPGAAKSKVYTWIDAKGTVHFGERPPKDVKATLVKTRTGHSDPSPEQLAATQPKVAPQETTTTASTQSLKDPARCAAAKENLVVLNTVARIRAANPEGVMIILSEEEKAQRRITTQKVIDQACE